MRDDLYQRYQAAHRARLAHTTSCTNCQDGARCLDGERLYERLAQLQDAYLNHQRRQRGR